MGKIGRYTYPEIGPKEAETIVQRIRSDFGETITKEDREDLAVMIGHESADSGAFKQKLSALKKYGLLKGRGNLQTSELADRLIQNNRSTYREMLDNVELLNAAYNHFNGKPVKQPEWESYLEKYTGLKEGVEEIRGSEKLRDIYQEFVYQIPSEEETKVLDKERDFNYYIEKLGNPNTRQLAINALRSNLRSKRLPDDEPVDVILEYIRDETYPEQLSDFYDLLRVICRQNDLLPKKENQVVGLLYEKLDKYTAVEHIGKYQDSREIILDILEQLRPEGIVDKWWDLLIQTLIEGNEIPNKEMRYFATRRLSERLMVNDTEIRKEFFNRRADKAEDELWNLMAKSANDNLLEDCEYLLNRMDVL